MMHAKPLPKKYRDVKRHLKIKRSSAGFGLFTETPIETGGFVVEYAGPILTLRQVLGKRCKYLFETNPRRFIDGSPRWNLARYINHCCAPNCLVRIVHGRVYIFAKRVIQAGEELGYDYEKEYFNEFIKPMGCRCIKCKS